MSYRFALPGAVEKVQFRVSLEDSRPLRVAYNSVKFCVTLMILYRFNRLFFCIQQRAATLENAQFASILAGQRGNTSSTKLTMYLEFLYKKTGEFYEIT